ncbi:hypothetical protein ES703_104361 [subsurface metagenome]
MVTTTDRRKHLARLLLHPYFTLLSRVVLGGVLIFAGIVKLPHTRTLIWEIDQYHILPGSLATVYGHALPSLAIVLGSLLVLGVWLKISASLSGLLVLSFTIAKITAIARGLDIDICPCFGPAVPLLAVPSLAIDFVLLALVLQLLLHRGSSVSR